MVGSRDGGEAQTLLLVEGERDVVGGSSVPVTIHVVCLAGADARSGVVAVTYGEGIVGE